MSRSEKHVALSPRPPRVEDLNEIIEGGTDDSLGQFAEWALWVLRNGYKKEARKVKIAVLGAGYVGLVTGACLSDLGHDVHVFDTDRDKIEKLQDGICPIFEPGLDLMLENLSFAHVDQGAVDSFDFFYIAVGTPSTEEGFADMQYLRSAVDWIVKNKVEGIRQTIVIKSTVPPGTAAMVMAMVESELDVVSNPEFLKEGSAIEDFANPDRVVIGTTDGMLAHSPFWRIVDIYNGSGVSSDRFISMSNASAELAKYASNGMLATRISFMNEMSQIAEAVGAEIDDIKHAVGSDRRIGPSFINAGPGWGGSCFPKDLTALGIMSPLPATQSVVKSAISANHAQKNYIVRRALQILSGRKNQKVCVLGASFKPNTDDTRDSPALAIIQKLRMSGCVVTVHDPIAKLDEKWLEDNVVVQPTCMYAAAHNASLLILLSDWDEYKSADWSEFRRSMGDQQLESRPVVFDTRNVLSHLEVSRFLYLERL